jgi:hypothetical protein
MASCSAEERSGPLLAPRIPATCEPRHLKRRRYQQSTKMRSIISIVCMMPLMLIVGLDGPAASAVLPTGGVAGGLLASTTKTIDWWRS